MITKALTATVTGEEARLTARGTDLRARVSERDEAVRALSSERTALLVAGDIAAAGKLTVAIRTATDERDALLEAIGSVDEQLSAVVAARTAAERAEQRAAAMVALADARERLHNTRAAVVETMRSFLGVTFLGLVDDVRAAHAAGAEAQHRLNGMTDESQRENWDGALFGYQQLEHLEMIGILERYARGFASSASGPDLSQAALRERAATSLQGV